MAELPIDLRTEIVHDERRHRPSEALARDPGQGPQARPGRKGWEMDT